MGFKSTLTFTRLEAIQTIARQVDAQFDTDIDKQLELILEKITDYENSDSKYYFYNFCVMERP